MERLPYKLLFIVIGSFVSIGCHQSTPSGTASGPGAIPAQTPAGLEETPGVEPVATTTATSTSTPETPAARQTEAASPDATPAQPAPTATSSTERVTLGDPALTAGIPGDGPLTVEELTAWLDDPRNHAPLEIELPLGLAAGTGMIQGLADNPLTRAKIELGRQLYMDRRLSQDATVSCADCHHPDEAFARHTRFGVGIRNQEGNRNSPVAYNRILSGPQFWDGRAGSLEEQAVGPIANPIEMGNTHELCVQTVKGIAGYRLQFERIFPDGVTIENVGKAIATFERALVTNPSAYDLYEPVRVFEANFKAELEDLEAFKEEEPDLYEQYQQLVQAAAARPMSESARRGRELFFSDRGGCTACHVGANFTDEKYHNLGIGMDAAEPDLGRFVVTNDEKDKGAFKTPTVRNVASSGPYMHDGSLKTLEEVVEWYDKGGHPNPYLSDKVKKLNLTAQEKQDLVEFMQALEGDLPQVNLDRLPQ